MVKTAQQHLPDNDVIESILRPFDIKPSDEQSSKIRDYIRLLLKWNQSVSLTSVSDPKEILAIHFGESMFVSTMMAVENCRLADVGAGAGFPGLALKIISPSLRLVLVEPNKKKCAFLSEVVRTLGLDGVEIVAQRFQDINAGSGYADIITSRALGGYRELLKWSKAALDPEGRLILWLGMEEISRISSSAGWNWQLPAHIPGSKRRFILIGRPNQR